MKKEICKTCKNDLIKVLDSAINYLKLIIAMLEEIKEAESINQKQTSP